LSNICNLIYLEEAQQEEESYVDYASVIDQMQTKITVLYGNSIMEEGEPFVSGKKFVLLLIKIKYLFSYLGNYNEQLRIIDFPVYISGENDTNMTRLVPDT
jgi:hypothetical protein